MNSTEPTVADLDRELNQMLQEHKLLEAFERFYSSEVSMQENGLPATTGKLANRARVERFLESIREIHRIELIACAACGDVTFSEWIYEVEPEEGGRRITCQIAVRRWAKGQIIHERFYYSLR